MHYPSLDATSILHNNSGNKTTKTSLNDTSLNKNESLLDLDLNFSANTSTNVTNTNSSIPVSISLSKVVENNLYNIDEDKEVESSFQYGQIDSLLKKNSNVASSSPMTTSVLNPIVMGSGSTSNNNNNNSNTSSVNNTLMNVSSILNSSSSTNVNTGRFTPACFPGRTTPDFRHSASLFEQGNRASIISPLTVIIFSHDFYSNN